MARDREKRFSSAVEAVDAWRRVCRVMGNAANRGAPSSLKSREAMDDKTEVTVATFAGSSSTLNGISRKR